MKRSKEIITIDTHTMGEPTRLVVGGLDKVEGKTMREKRGFIAKNLDYVRTALMHEPRGHKDMFGAILVEPVNSEADLGVIFMDGGGYLDMCGHGSFGVVTAAMKMGIIKLKESRQTVILETPAGLVSATVDFGEDDILAVTIRNVPSFLYLSEIVVKTKNWGDVLVDIAYGGNYFALVKASDLNLTITLEQTESLRKAGMEILTELRRSLPIISLPKLEKECRVDLVEICGPANSEGADASNVVIFGKGQVDRSPCGTGTCAKMAAKYAKGELALNQPFVHESIIGTRFEGCLLDEVQIDGIKAVIPEIRGRAFVTGVQHYFIDPDDPLKYGFQLE